MIFGVGIDIANISNFDRLTRDETTSFFSRSFTPEELEYSKAHFSGRPEQHLAARYAVKEAAIKAFEQARSDRHPPLASVDYLEMEVVLDSAGRPGLVLKGQFEDIAKAIGIRRVLVSLSHEDNYAVAVVILEG